jgi:predicted actin-binding protein
MNRRVLGAAAATALLLLALALFATIGTAASGSASAAQYVPANSAPPTISGTPQEGSTLTTSTGQWSSTSASAYSFQWQRCDSASANCADIVGATSQSYVVQTADVGKTLRSVVTASNADGVSKANSAPTSVVTSKSTQTTSGSAVDASAVVPPSRLVIDAVRFTPGRITSRNPVQLRVHIATTEGKVVRGALVYVAAIPFGRINQPAEVSTDANGWATLSLQPTLRLPLRDGYLLTIFIRARKSGDSVLAGVSSRRLVSARVGSPAS